MRLINFTLRLSQKIFEYFMVLIFVPIHFFCCLARFCIDLSFFSSNILAVASCNKVKIKSKANEKKSAAKPAGFSIHERTYKNVLHVFLINLLIMCMQSACGKASCTIFQLINLTLRMV